jgi:hypothetical protein
MSEHGHPPPAFRPDSVHGHRGHSPHAAHAHGPSLEAAGGVETHAAAEVHASPGPHGHAAPRTAAPRPWFPFTRRRVIAFCALMLVCAGVGVFFTYDGRPNRPLVDELVEQLGAKNYDQAFLALSLELQQELGSAAELGERWERSGVRVAPARQELSCMHGGFGSYRLGFKAEVAIAPGGSGVFQLGSLRRRDQARPCRRNVTAEVAREDGELKVTALHVVR